MNNIVDLTTAQKQVPIIQNGKVPPRRVKNSVLRSREYLTQDEVEKLMEAAGKVVLRFQPTNWHYGSG